MLNKFQYKIGSKGIFILISIITITLIVDTSIVKISAITGELSSTNSSIAIFVIMMVIFVVGQYLILGFVRKLDEKKAAIKRLRLAAISRSVSIIQYFIIAIFASVILQMLFTSSYSVQLLELVIWINYSLAIVLLGFLSYRFLSWFRYNHNPVILAYSIADYDDFNKCRIHHSLCY